MSLHWADGVTLADLVLGLAWLIALYIVLEIYRAFVLSDVLDRLGQKAVWWRPLGEYTAMGAFVALIIFRPF